MDRSRLSLHMPDADKLTDDEIHATRDLKPSAMLCLIYAAWDSDKGVAEQMRGLVRDLDHDRLYVRFHADPHPPGYAKAHGGPEAWGRLCARRMEQYYGMLGVQLHAILANETDADYEGGLSPAQASDFYRRAIYAYHAERPQDILHVPAPTGAPQTHREHLERYKADGWVTDAMWIDGHGYNGDLENVLAVLEDVFPKNRRVITETNDLNDFGWPIELIRQGRVEDIAYFVLNWARGGIGRVQPPSADDAAKQMSLLRFPARYQQFRATIAPVIAAPAPEPEPEPPVEPEMPTPDPWEFWSADEIAAATQCPPGAVSEHWPRVFGQMVLCGIADRPVQMAALGTIAVETASTFLPLHEYGTPADWERYSGGAAYAGRGFIQLTHDFNYQLYGAHLAALWGNTTDPNMLVDTPDMALDPDVAAAVLALYFVHHTTIQGYSIPEAARAGDWEWVRRLVQGGVVGLPRLREIATALGETAVDPVPEPVLAYNPDAIVDRQPDDWSCSVQSAQWLLRSLGRDPGDAWMEQSLVPAVVSKSVGLLNATGQGMAEWIEREYGYPAEWRSGVSFDDVLALAGRQPVMIGGRTYGPGGHWVGVRRADENGWLELANPAPNYTNTGTHLDRNEWAARGPWSLVTVPVEEAGEDMARIAELEARVAELEAQRDGLVTAIAVMADDEGDKIAAAARKLQEIREQFIGARPAA